MLAELTVIVQVLFEDVLRDRIVQAALALEGSTSEELERLLLSSSLTESGEFVHFILVVTQELGFEVVLHHGIFNAHELGLVHFVQLVQLGLLHGKGDIFDVLDLFRVSLFFSIFN